MTAFCMTELPLWESYSLFLDGNSKVCVGNGTFENPKPNALSLGNVASCPGATPICLNSCYVFGLRKSAPEVYAKYDLNSRSLHHVLLSSALQRKSALILAEWINANASSGFRWHVSGDVMHERHADWIYQVCRNSPSVPHWIYTRTPGVVPILVNAPNLAVNVSADASNYEWAKGVASSYGVRICYLSHDGTLPDDLPEDSVIFPDYGLRGRDLEDPTQAPWWKGLTLEQKRQTCPADFLGQSPSARCGPCDKCLFPRRAQP